RRPFRYLLVLEYHRSSQHKRLPPGKVATALPACPQTRISAPPVRDAPQLRVRVVLEETVERLFVSRRQPARHLLHLGGRQRLEALGRADMLFDMLQLGHPYHGGGHRQRERVKK